jgi:hypothetical protein
MVELEPTVPEGLYGGHYLALLLNQRGLELTHFFYVRPWPRETAQDRAGDFVRILVPVTPSSQWSRWPSLDLFYCVSPALGSGRVHLPNSLRLE